MNDATIKIRISKELKKRLSKGYSKTIRNFLEEAYQGVQVPNDVVLELQPIETPEDLLAQNKHLYGPICKHFKNSSSICAIKFVVNDCKGKKELCNCGKYCENEK